VAQGIEGLPSKHKALSSNPIKKKKSPKEMCLGVKLTEGKLVMYNFDCQLD
jgi:hypothetical protein